jgi:hypothetical protein
MKKLPFLLGLLLLSVGLSAQQSLLVFLEASEKKPFYVKIGNKVNVSSSNGQVYITELNGTSFDIFIGFPQTDLPENRFQVTLKKNDNSFQLKQANQGWILIDLENDKVIQPAATVVNTSIPLGGVKKTDAFSIMMAGVVNDTAVLYTSVISTPPMVSESTTTGQEPAKSNTVHTDVSPVDPAVNAQNQGEKKTPEKLRTIASVDSTRVKHVDSSLAYQRAQAANQASKDSLSKSTEASVNKNSVQKESSIEPLKSEEVTGKTAVATGQSALGKKENTNREDIVRDSLEKVAVKDAAAKDAADKDAAAKDAADKDAAAKDVAAKDAALKDAAAKDATLKEAAAKEVLIREAATKDSLSKLTAANDASVKAAIEKDSIARANALKDSLTRETLAKETASKEALDKENAAKAALAKEAADKEALDKENAAKAALAKEAAAKEALDKENAAKETLAKEKATKDSVQKAALKSNTPGINTLSEVKKITEKKTEKSLIVSYTDKNGNGKTDTIQIIIPIDQPAASVPKMDSIYPRWQSNPRPLTGPVVSKKDSGSNPGAGMAQPVSKVPVMVNSDCVNFATEYDLDKLRVKMIAEVTADDRIAAAKKVFRTKCFTTRQIRALTELFLNDEGKYKFLDTAYPFASDSGEFRNLVSVLKEDYYIKRFNAMIRL